MFGCQTLIQLTSETILIELETAKAYDNGPTPPPLPPPPLPKRFYGNVELAPISAKLDFATIVDEVLEQFTSKVGTQVKITIEIEAESDEGFGENQQRAVRENCGMLRFTNAEFPE